MARATQYVGLTQRAERFVASKTLLPSTRTVEGTCGEEIKLREWQAVGEVFPKDAVIREVAQALPWSSGAMIFTCLEVEYSGGKKVQFLQWIADPLAKDQQFDRDIGTYWV